MPGKKNKIVEYECNARWLVTVSDTELEATIKRLLVEAEPYRQAGYEVRDMPPDFEPIRLT